jgi:four helix bundle protein
MVQRFEELRVYQQGFDAAMQIYEESRSWPSEERYSLTDQIRRSSRSVCANIAEAWRKRRYPGHFVSKLSDADTKAAETQNWLNFAHSCGYLSEEKYQQLYQNYNQLIGGLVNMMTHPDKWCSPAKN